MSYHYPPGWAPPYQGGAPPMPQNYAVNQQQWQSGSWQFNPAYNVHRYPAPQMQWMAAPAWGPPVQPRPQNYPTNFNPYKKQIKPPSAEYLAMKVAPNGLDLHGMVAIENPYGDEADPSVPKTPWIWNPATLSNDGQSVTAQRAVIAAANERAQIRHSSEPPLSETSNTSHPPRHATDPSSSSSASSYDNTRNAFGDPSPLKPTFSPKIIRIPAHYPRPSNPSSTSVDSLTKRMDRLSASSEPSSLGRHSSMPSIYSDSNTSSSISGAQISDEPASILSPLIIPTTPRANRSVTRNATYPEINGQSSLGTIVEAPPPASATESNTRYNASSHAPPSAPQTAPASQDSFRRPKNHRSDTYPRSQPTYSISFEPKPGSSVQQHTPPDPDAHPSTSTSHHRPPPPNLDAYTRTSPPDPRPHTPRRPIEIYASAPTPPPRGPQRSQSFNDTPTRYNNTTSNIHTSSRDSSPSRRTRSSFDIPHYTPPSPPSRQTPPSNTHPNEYPITPISMHRKSTITSTQTRTPPSHRPPSTPQPHPTSHSQTPRPSPTKHDEHRPAPVPPHRIYTPISVPRLSASSPKRWRGFFNRRGDHVTPEGYIVYAPPDLSFPQELDGYPERDYQDDLGFRIAFDDTRPELPESLPRYGQPPERPYRDFLKYA
ncbi:hypothetical protein DXG01_006118 [Tephrocybe rancida]|nr:hypothetical protein DXG01_006118 [Tephrocybe rancida]